MVHNFAFLKELIQGLENNVQTLNRKVFLSTCVFKISCAYKFIPSLAHLERILRSILPPTYD